MMYCPVCESEQPTTDVLECWIPSKCKECKGISTVPMQIYINCPACSASIDTEGMKEKEIQWCDVCRQKFVLVPRN